MKYLTALVVVFSAIVISPAAFSEDCHKAKESERYNYYGVQTNWTGGAPHYSGSGPLPPSIKGMLMIVGFGQGKAPPGQPGGDTPVCLHTLPKVLPSDSIQVLRPGQRVPEGYVDAGVEMSVKEKEWNILVLKN